MKNRKFKCPLLRFVDNLCISKKGSIHRSFAWFTTLIMVMMNYIHYNVYGVNNRNGNFTSFFWLYVSHIVIVVISIGVRGYNQKTISFNFSLSLSWFDLLNLIYWFHSTAAAAEKNVTTQFSEFSSLVKAINDNNNNQCHRMITYWYQSITINNHCNPNEKTKKIFCKSSLVMGY